MAKILDEQPDSSRAKPAAAQKQPANSAFPQMLYVTQITDGVTKTAEDAQDTDFKNNN